MDLRIRDRVALVTAASRGLGYAVAEQLVEEGVKVAICSRDKDRINEAKDKIAQNKAGEISAYVVDVTDGPAVKNMINDIIGKYGKIDILVCNAGGPPAGMYDDFSLEDYKKALDLNLMSTVTLCYEIVPIMKKNNWGRIINITSISAKQPVDNLILSNTARAGVLGFSKSLSNQVASHGITVNSVCPGYTLTERVVGLAQKFVSDGKGSEKEFYDKVESSIPAGRMGEPEEFAQTVAFLASEGAAYINGVALQIDGGLNKGII